MSNIIFDAESIRAIRDGRKTQTRRVVVDVNESCFTLGIWPTSWGDQPSHEACFFDSASPTDTYPTLIRCPYGKPGDLVWARETWCEYPKGAAIYRADYGRFTPISDGIGGPWRSPIHMPRWASRLTLELTDVRVQRVQDICDSDAVDEGVEYRNGFFHGSQHRVKGTPKVFPDAPSAFADRWDAINANRGYPWASNPWVWVLTFMPIWKNIDAVLAERGDA